jgi:hypothetical protein
MPMIIPVVAAAAAGTAIATSTVVIGALGTIGAAVAGAVAGAVVATATGKALGLGKQPSAPQSFDSTSRGALLNTASTIDQIPVIYGTRRVGGTRIFTELSGPSNGWLNLVYAIGEGPVSAIDSVYLDNELTTAARFNDSNGTNHVITVNKHLGEDDQVADNDLINEMAEAGSPTVQGKWTSNHRGRGVAYVYLKLQWSPQGIWNGLPTVNFDVDGRTIYDPRGGSPTLTAWSDNPALCILDYLTNTRYGRGVPLASIDSTTFEDAADYCDELVSVPVAGSPSFTTQKRYTCNGIVNPDSSTLENMRALLTSCRGSLVYSGGLYKLRLDKATTSSSFGFTEDNIIGEWSIRLPGKRDKVNRIRARFFDPDRDWQPNIAVVDSPAYRTEDNGLLLEREMDLPFTANIYMAQHIATIEMKQSRIGIVCSFRAVQEGLRCEVGDVVPITHSTPGWTDKLFRITSIDIMSSDEVRITAREYDATVYDLDTLSVADAAPSTNLPDIFTVSPPSGSPGVDFAQDTVVKNRGVVTWTAPSDSFVSQYQVEWKLTSESDYRTRRTTATEMHLDQLAPGTYDIRVSAFNAFGKQSSYVTTQGQIVSHWKVDSYYGTADFIGAINLVGLAEASWQGSPQNHVLARILFCPRNRKIYGCDLGVSGFSIAPDPLDPTPVITQILSGQPVQGLAYAPTTGYLYFALDRASSPTPAAILVVDPMTDTVVAQYSPAGSREFDSIWFNPGDNYLWCLDLLGDTLYVVDPETGSLVHTVAVPVSGDLKSLVYCPSNGKTYAGGGLTSPGELFPIPIVGSPQYASEAAVALAGQATAMCYVPSIDRIAIALVTGAIALFDPHTNSVESTVSVAAYDMIYVGQGDRLFATNYGVVGGTDYLSMIVPSTVKAVTRSIEIGGSFVHCCFCPDNNKLYATTDNGAVAVMAI